LKPATKSLGMHRIFMRSKGRKHVITDRAFERLQVGPRPYWLDTDEHHLGLAPRTGGTLEDPEQPFRGKRKRLRRGPL
jgi:hypothetical protein